MLTQEQQKLVEDNHGLIISYLISRNLDIDDYYGDAALGLCKAAEVYSTDKGAFSTIAYTCMKHFVGHEFRRYKAFKRGSEFATVSYDVELNNADGDNCTLKDFIPNGDEFESLSCNQMVIREVVSKLPERDKTILGMYINGKTQTEIATHIGLSQVQISRIIIKCRDTIGGALYAV